LQTAKAYDAENNTQLARGLIALLFSSPLTNHESAYRILSWIQAGKPPAAGDLFQLTCPHTLQDELVSFREVVSKIEPALLDGIVAHRGFHYSNDSINRPLENTLQAMEMVRNFDCFFGFLIDLQFYF
jgi:hypothetical protein